MAIMSMDQPMVFVFGILGNIISTMVYLSPLPTFIRIYKKKSTEDFQSLPYLVALFSSMLWLYYAVLKKDAFLLITINSFGCVVEIIYILMYLTYASKASRATTLKLIVAMNMGSFSLILLLTHFLVRESLKVEVLGWINVAISVCVFAAPLSVVAQVIKTKSVEYMPFPLSFCLTICAIMWFSYGMFLKDLCIAVPNVVGFFLGLIQMSLYGMYRKSKPVLDEKKLPPEELKTVVVVTDIGATELYPVTDVKLQTNEVAEEVPQTEVEPIKKLQVLDDHRTMEEIINFDDCKLKPIPVN